MSGVHGSAIFFEQAVMTHDPDLCFF